MTTFSSLQELGKHFPWSGDACIGAIYKVPDADRGISTSAYWHPGILCGRNSQAARFSMGTDWKRLNVKDKANYFRVCPNEENGLTKKTGFDRILTVVEKPQSPKAIMGNLGDSECQVCLGKTVSGSSHKR